MRNLIGLWGLIVALLATVGVSRPALGASQAEINASIGRGATYLRQAYPTTKSEQKSLVALALYKAGLDKDAPEIANAMELVRAKCSTGKYKATGAEAGLYEAGVDATLLADVDPAGERETLVMLRDYILSERLPTGAWDYPTHPGDRAQSVGDMSVTQYACLGLWAVDRAGAKVNPQVWETVLQWHAKYQNNDGGYNYLPFQSPNSTLNMSINGLGNIFIAILHIDPGYSPLTPGKARTQPKTEEAKPKFGVLETVTIENPGEADPSQPRAPLRTTTARVPAAATDAARKVFAYITTRFRRDDGGSQFGSYYFYSLERMAALANLEEIGDHNWYDECADYVVSKQRNDGAWGLATHSHISTPVDTAFSVLFLSRSTGKLLKRAITEPGFGEGILAAGRGLPDDLLNVDSKGGKIGGKNKPVEPLEKLLASLTVTGDVNIDEVQDQIVEQIQVQDRQALIGNIEMLIKLTQHSNPEVRRTAIWAIGRSDDLKLGTYLINALDDPDLGVIIEAQNALCWISRKPLGFGHAEDPLADLPPTASEQQRKDAISVWYRKLLHDWGNWYLAHRPFESRGDEFESQLRLKLERMRLSGQIP
ncbi:HEAT repeat domain-containing protein [Planctomicrobium sp. SH664]|uniref:HEAT repeat domain-containing protein n=1 Tax=Planctomicrobium sp. SH664 TaxID=3448125 RepID=UPI003F5B4722